MRHETAGARLWFAVLLFVLGLLAVMPAQTYDLWKGSIAGSELGQFVAIAGLILLLIPFWWRTSVGQVAAALTVVAIGMAISPTIRALNTGRNLDSRLTAAFGNTTPRSFGEAQPMSSPISISRLLSPRSKDRVPYSTLIYTMRGDKKLELDLYRLPDTTVRGPLVITIHGGSWVGGSREDLPQLNHYLAARGYVVAALSYRFAPDNPFPAATEDVNTAIDYLVSRAKALRFDSTKIVLVGRSAGGQLALQSAYTKNDPRIKGVVSLYGPTDQTWGWEHPTNPRVYDSFATLRTFMNGEPSQIPDKFKAASPINYIGSHTIPTLTIHGSMDPLVSVRQSARLDSALTAMKRQHMMIEMPWATHGCDYLFNGPCGQTSTFAIERFIAAVTR